ncbi:SH3 domain-containing protein [Pedosphaera parvula]|uniref:SH3 type 3 domain protein n=1 Tax=Pedosphaera parvula (strain Ellin514) TaxID=320771 RepID=B9XS60_PEDPL|nr:SH3 domain-containing protein [Pedosphaera parvula]EEF57315.1 SH3 type 3 domain protein [Pedosphaera parvula Ellin514]
MKMKYGLILAGLLSTGVMAQVPSNTPPSLPPVPDSGASVPPAVSTPAPAPATPGPLPSDTTVTTPAPADAGTNLPAAKPAKKSSKKKTDKAAKKSTEKKEAKAAKPAVAPKEEAAPLALNQPAVAKQDHVNVRGQANINSEVIAHLKKDQVVTVLEEITLKHPKTDEPAKWAKIALPSDTHVYVNSAFLDNGTVKPAKLNLRTGPGENYSVAGLLHKGDAVKAVGNKGDWTEIEAPTNAFAFVAAHLLAPAPATPPVEIAAANTPAPAAPAPPTPAPVENNPPVAAPPTEVPSTPPAVVPTPEPPPVAVAPPVVTPALPTPPAPEEPPAKRVVQREGIVTGTVSIQAPTYFQLKSINNGGVIDYLYSDSTNLVLKRFKGKKVMVSGEEGLDERWPNTPVLTVQSIQPVE